MKDLISAAEQRVQHGERAVLCCVLEAEGSAPRGAGARMAVLADGTTLGTVGGGALELEATRRAGELLEAGRSEVRSLALHRDVPESLGMVCGGSVLLGFHCLVPEDRAAVSVMERLAALPEGMPAWLRTVWHPDGTASLTLTEGEDLHSEGERLPNKPVLNRTEAETVFLEPIFTPERVWIFGGGHVGRALVPALAAVGFAVTVVDERPALADPARFPAARQVLCGSYAELLPTLTLRHEDYAVVMTQGHLADLEVLSAVLRTPACYIGCIGSRKKAAFVNDQLREKGFSEAELARIHSPIGLPILAQTPEEIAVSITAEMILHRHGGRQPLHRTGL